ncbi:DUF3164 family protein [Sphingobacterium multivorum]|uniref:DUF3164 family protein n=1 Tax=Sphingobacterium multivorum TaxID=28454 RepID=UPI0028AACD25|nr:DUF3164 family protein [Sphingobacterium multivorum]
METTTLNKPASELTLEEIQALLNQKKDESLSEKQKAREAYESLRDENVTSLVEKAMKLHKELASFKSQTFEDIDTLYKLLQEHSSRHQKGKGNVTLDTSDGQYRLVFKRSDNTRFDERATQAEAHIIDFIANRWGEKDDADSRFIKKLLERKNGKLDKNKVLDMISMKDNYNDPHWQKGIELLQESIVPDTTRFYAEYYVRSEDNEWLPVVLNYARLND